MLSLVTGTWTVRVDLLREILGDQVELVPHPLGRVAGELAAFQQIHLLREVGLPQQDDRLAARHRNVERDVAATADPDAGDAVLRARPDETVLEDEKLRCRQEQEVVREDGLAERARCTRCGCGSW